MNYIYELWKDKREEKLINEYKKLFPNTKIYLIHKNFANLNLLFRNNDEEFLAEYSLSSFDCKLNCENGEKIENYYKRYRVHLTEDFIKRIYFDFMKRAFKDYKQKYLSTVNHESLLEDHEMIL